MTHQIVNSEAHLPREQRLFAREVYQYPPRKSRWHGVAGTIRMLAEFCVVAGFCGFVIKLATLIALKG